MPARTRARRTATAGTPEMRCDLRVAEARSLCLEQRRPDDPPLGRDDLREPIGEPRGDAGGGRDGGRIGPAVAEKGDHPPQTRVRWGQEGQEVTRRPVGKLPRRVLPQPAAAARLQ